MLESVQQRSGPPMGCLVGGGLLGAVVLGLGVWFGAPLWQVLTGQRTLEGEAKWEDRVVRAPLMYGEVDLRAAYTAPLSSWSAALSRGEREATLGEALQAAPELWARFEEVHQLAGDDAPYEALVASVRAINDATAAEGAAVWLHPWQQGSFYVKSYEVLADLEVQVGEVTRRARYVRRLDTLNVREGRLGHVADPEEGAIILADRTRDFVVDEVWPSLTRTPPSDPLLAALVPQVIYALGDALGGDALVALRSSAEVRRELLDTVASITDRGDRCATIRLSRPAWYGYDPELRTKLRAIAHEDRGVSTCERVRVAEARAIDEAFASLVADDAAQQALRSVFGLAGRGVLLHEVRHAADEELACVGCPDGLEGSAMREASAYLASLHDEVSAPLSWLQMCQVAAETRGAHARAARAVTDALAEHGCVSGVPVDVAAKAAAVDASWFGERAAPTLPADAPATLALF